MCRIHFNPVTLITASLISAVDFTRCRKIEDRESPIDTTILLGKDLSCERSCVPWHNPEVDPRPSVADHSTSHFSRERTKGTPSGGGDGARACRTIWLGYLYLYTDDGRLAGISRARQKTESRSSTSSA